MSSLIVGLDCRPLRDRHHPCFIMTTPSGRVADIIMFPAADERLPMGRCVAPRLHFRMTLQSVYVCASALPTGVPELRSLQWSDAVPAVKGG
jgi:hypothetical protein